MLSLSTCNRCMDSCYTFLITYEHINLVVSKHQYVWDVWDTFISQLEAVGCCVLLHALSMCLIFKGIKTISVIYYFREYAFIRFSESDFIRLFKFTKFKYRQRQSVTSQLKLVGVKYCTKNTALQSVIDSQQKLKDMEFVANFLKIMYVVCTQLGRAQLFRRNSANISFLLIVSLKFQYSILCCLS